MTQKYVIFLLKNIVDWDSGFFATFFVRHHAHRKKVGRLLPPYTKTGVESRYHREHFFQHIAVYALVRFNVLRLALECLFAECPAVETHIVEV